MHISTQDAHDLLHAMLTRLHEEYIRATPLTKSRGAIAEMFRFNVQSLVTCKTCKNTTHSNETYTDLSLEIVGDQEPTRECGVVYDLCKFL